MNVSIAAGLGNSALRGRGLLLVALIAGCVTLPLIYQGFATGDSYLYANGVLRLEQQGYGQFGGVFNGEMSFGYYSLLLVLHRWLGPWFSLSTIMNCLSAVGIIVSIVLLAALFTRLAGGTVVGVGSALAALLSPAIWFAGLYGNPGALGLGFFSGALLAWDVLLARGLPLRGAVRGWCTAVILYVLALSCRMDLVLGAGAFAGLYACRRQRGRTNLAALLAVVILSVVIAICVRSIILGHLHSPTAGVVMRHVTKRLGISGLHIALGLNTSWWVLGVNPLLALLAVAAILRRGARDPLTALLLCWSLPYVIFLPFHGMATGRLIGPMAPAVALAAVMGAVQFRPRRPAAVVALVLVLSQLVGLAVGLAAGGLGSFRKEFHGMAIANHPVGFVPLDRYYRQPYMMARDEVARRVAAIRDGDVLIVGLDELAPYEHHLIVERKAFTHQRCDCADVVLECYPTETNLFRFFDPNLNLRREYPLRALLASEETRGARVHVTPFSTAYATDPRVLLLDEAGIERLLASEGEITGQRKRLIKAGPAHTQD